MHIVCDKWLLVPNAIGANILLCNAGECPILFCYIANCADSLCDDEVASVEHYLIDVGVTHVITTLITHNLNMYAKGCGPCTGDLIIGGES